MDDHERDGMETKRTYHGWQMDEDRSCGMRSIEIDGETQKETRKRRRRMMERARRLGRVWMEATWNGTQCSSCFVSFRFVGGSWWFPKMRRSKPSIDARGRHWIAPCEAKDDVCSHAFPTKNERIDGKKPRRKQIHETRHTHPSTIDHETRHDAIVHRPTPSCFFFFFFWEDDVVDPSRASRMTWIRSFPLRPTRLRVQRSRRVRTATHAFLLLSFRSFVRRIRRALVSVRSEERSIRFGGFRDENLFLLSFAGGFLRLGQPGFWCNSFRLMMFPFFPRARGLLISDQLEWCNRDILCGTCRNFDISRTGGKVEWVGTTVGPCADGDGAWACDGQTNRCAWFSDTTSPNVFDTALLTVGSRADRTQQGWAVPTASPPSNRPWIGRSFRG